MPKANKLLTEKAPSVHIDRRSDHIRSKVGHQEASHIGKLRAGTDAPYGTAFALPATYRRKTLSGSRWREAASIVPTESTPRTRRFGELIYSLIRDCYNWKPQHPMKLSTLRPKPFAKNFGRYHWG